MSLYQLERDGSVSALVDYLTQSGNAGIRARTATIIGDLDIDDAKRPTVIEKLIRTAREDEEPEVRTAAVDALCRLGPDALDRFIAAVHGEGDATGEEVMLSAYRSALASDRPALRMAAVGGMGRRGDHTVLPALLGALDDPDRRVRARAARACGSIGHSGATSALIDCLEDDAVPVRRAAAEALGQIGDHAGLTALMDRVNDPDDIVRYVAVSGLGGFASVESLEALVTALEDESPSVRRAAALSMIEMLANAPADRSHQIRQAMLDSVRVADDHHMIEPLLEIVREGTRDPYRRNAAWLLGRLAGDRSAGRVVDALIGLLDADDQRTVQVAVTSLLALQPRVVEHRVLKRLEDEGWSSAAKQKAVFVLGKVGSERSWTALETMRQRTQDEGLERQLTAAIAKLGGPA